MLLVFLKENFGPISKDTVFSVSNPVDGFFVDARTGMRIPEKRCDVLCDNVMPNHVLVSLFEDVQQDNTYALVRRYEDEYNDFIRYVEDSSGRDINSRLINRVLDARYITLNMGVRCGVYKPSVCSTCGAKTNIYTATRPEDGHTVPSLYSAKINGVKTIMCNDCLSKYKMCQCCGGYFDAEHITEMPTGQAGDIYFDYIPRHTYRVCELCAPRIKMTRCALCGENIPQKFANNITIDGLVRHICGRCYVAKYIKCSCGVHVLLKKNETPKDHGFENFGGNKWRCESCAEELHSMPINAWDFKPEVNLNGKSKDNLYFGVEIEVYVHNEYSRESVAISVKNKLNDCKRIAYCKHDSSVGRGFEIVTHPMSYDYILSIRDKIESVFEMKRGGYISNSAHGLARDGNKATCGMHVHMSRDAFTNIHLYKFLRLFYTSEQQMFALSGRSSTTDFSRWCNFDLRIMNGRTDKNNKVIKSMTVAKLVRDKDNVDRHIAVSLAQQSTVEVRIFKSTLIWSTFIRNIQLCIAVFEFTKTVSVSDVTFDNLVKFIKENKSRYKQLYRSIARGKQ